MVIQDINKNQNHRLKETYTTLIRIADQLKLDTTTISFEETDVDEEVIRNNRTQISDLQNMIIF